MAMPNEVSSALELIEFHLFGELSPIAGFSEEEKRGRKEKVRERERDDSAVEGFWAVKGSRQILQASSKASSGAAAEEDDGAEDATGFWRREHGGGDEEDDEEGEVRSAMGMR
ncbi:hypothetical protein SLEP1_g46451 [Rubroshorea leprosula]|uniref:Uncharacterized protein n=1 Tax=Rubroshorea leprosula TaxID=152421 RepID=A0AAV5LP27_9ROSI|nr:hypothetical protein SLEP1_g46451 [Rubroshorea leprosula]